MAICSLFYKDLIPYCYDTPIEKDFSAWHIIKTEIQRTHKKLLPFYEREIWFCSMGLNIGHEEDGKGDNFLRPVLILKKFFNNTFIGIPLIRTIRSGPFYFTFQKHNKDSVAILGQIKLMDAKRLTVCIGKIDRRNFYLIKQKLIKLFK